MIIVTGPDNSGKTTLVNQILQNHPGLVHWKSHGADSNYNLWMGALVRPPKEVGRLVCDRFFYDEYVYGPLVRGKICLTVHQQEVIHSMLMVAEPLVIQCHLIENEETFNDRPQLFDWETTLKTEELYDQVLGPGAALQYRAMFPAQVRHVMDRVRLYLEHVEEWLKVRTKCPYGRGQMRSPQLMIVGEKFSANNDWKVPFERSRSGHLLHNTLRTTGFTMDGIWFTNATKVSEPLSPFNVRKMEQEMELIQPQEVVALGNRASGLLSTIGVDHTKVRHPGWYLRKYSTQEANYEFLREFEQEMELGD